MTEVTDFFKHLFDTSGFPPRWKCGVWSDFHGWLYIISDLLIWAAYFTIPSFILSYLIRRKHSLSFHPLYFLFAAFILACGATHFIDALIFWHPYYRISAVVRLVTGIISWVTVFYIVRSIPEILSYKSPKELQKEIELRKQAEEELRENHDRIVESEQIARLCFAEWNLMEDRITFSQLGYELFPVPQNAPLTFDTFMNVVLPEDRDHLTTTAQKIAVTGIFEPFYFRTFSSNSEIKHIRATGKAVMNEHGIPVVLRGSLQDVTEQWENMRRIQMQNEKLKEIAWIQSHKVRGPLATIMGLSEIIDIEHANPDNVKVLESIKEVSRNLDNIIREIVRKAEDIE